MKKEVTLPTIVGLLVAVTGLISGLWLLRGQLGQGVKAVAEETPVELKITNVNDTSFTVSWMTERAVAGFIQYGEADGDPDLVVSDERDQQKGLIESYFTHYTVVRGLKPETVYAFRVGSGTNTYDQEGQPYSVTTGKELSNPPPADVAYGQVVTTSGEAAEGAIVYLSLPDAASQSALVKTSGSWVIPLSTSRVGSLDGYASYDKSDSLLELNVAGGPLGLSSVFVTTANDSPIPNITLGQNYDFRNESGAQQNTLPGSKFSTQSLAPASEATGSGQLILLAPKFGEKINSARPEIIGEAPAGVEVQIEIRSEPIFGTTVAGEDGKFSFSVPSDLPPGEHTVTISTLVGGVMEKITRSFTVYAEGESDLPFFTATPSATTVPTLSPTKQPGSSETPSPKPSPTVKISSTLVPTTTILPNATTKPTIALEPTLPATDSGLLETGNETPTLLLLLLGFGLVTIGAWWYSRLE